VLARLREAGVAERSIVMAFNPAVVAEIRALAPEQMTALLVERRHVESAGASSIEPVEWAARAGANFLGIHYSVCDAKMVAAARAAGIALGVYTVNDEADLRRLAALGVDVIISDRADLVATLQGSG
jgi:glycerophosphoryl diester phosphodiesterase